MRAVSILGALSTAFMLISDSSLWTAQVSAKESSKKLDTFMSLVKGVKGKVLLCS